MTARKPLVRIGGKNVQLPAEDVLDGAFAIRVYNVAPEDPPLYQPFIIVPVPDTQAPVLTAFVATSGVDSPIPITSLEGTDEVGITAWWIGETAALPELNDPGWKTTKPTSYVTASSGAVTLYARARDAAGNISGALSQAITMPFYTVDWPYSASRHTALWSVAAGSFSTKTAVPFTPPAAMTISAVQIPMRRQVEASYPGTGTVQLRVREGSVSGTILSTATVPVFTTDTVETKEFVLPSNLSLAAGTTYFFELSLVNQSGGDALYRVLADPAKGTIWFQYNTGAWSSNVGQSALRLRLA